MTNLSSELDDHLAEANRFIEIASSDENIKKFGYITHEDIRSLVKEEDKNVIAVKAPFGTNLAVPEAKVIEKKFGDFTRVKDFLGFFKLFIFFYLFLIFFLFFYFEIPENFFGFFFF